MSSLSSPTPSSSSSSSSSSTKKVTKRKNNDTPSIDKPVVSIYSGNCVTVGNRTFTSTKRELWVTELSDYTIISDRAINDQEITVAPSLKEVLNTRWIYWIHVSSRLESDVNRYNLNARVNGGQILGYKYLECSVGGNPASYYGVIPTDNLKLAEHAYKIPQLVTKAVFPRKLYVHLRCRSLCYCKTPNCRQWEIYAINSTNMTFQNMLYCGRDIPWSRIYVHLGDKDEKCVGSLRSNEIRNCNVCAQCYACSINNDSYCRKHRKCKHKNAIIYTNDELANIEPQTSRIKRCKVYTKR